MNFKYSSGSSSPTGKFSALAVAVASHEDHEAWEMIFKYVKTLNSPSVHLADGATAITKAIDEIFGLQNCTRIMCYPHVYRNVVPQLKSVNTFNKSVGAGILRDIEFMQWSVLNHQSFIKVYDLLEQKYLRKHDATVNKAIETFFQYMRSVWIESKQNLWFKGAHPWKISNNQGVEGKNKAIKQSHTFRRRLDMGQLFNVLLNMVSEWSREDQSLLLSSRLDSLFDQKDSLKLRTEGYQWYKSNMSKSDRILRINPRGKYSVNANVVNLWAVACSNDDLCSSTSTSLKENAKLRMKQRELPDCLSLDEYMSVRSSCWILEEVDGNFFCDCPIGMKVSIH